MTNITKSAAALIVKKQFDNAVSRLADLQGYVTKNPRYAASRADDLAQYAAEHAIYNEYHEWLNSDNTVETIQKIFSSQLESAVDRGLHYNASDYDRRYAQEARKILSRDDLFGMDCRLANLIDG